MNDYTQQLFLDHASQEKRERQSARIVGWMLAVVAAISITAYLSQDYWYPYVAPYLQR